MKEVLFLRHGESEADRLGVCAGHTDVDLTDYGREQAKLVGEELLESGKEIGMIVTSPLKRALYTTAIIADIIESENTHIVIDALAVERFLGRLEIGRSLHPYKMTDADYISHGAESEASMLERANRLMGVIDGMGPGLEAETCLVVSHDQFGRTLLASAWGIEREELEELPSAKLISVKPRLEDNGRIN